MVFRRLLACFIDNFIASIILFFVIYYMNGAQNFASMTVKIIGFSTLYICFYFWILMKRGRFLGYLICFLKYEKYPDVKQCAKLFLSTQYIYWEFVLFMVIMAAWAFETDYVSPLGVLLFSLMVIEASYYVSVLYRYFFDEKRILIDEWSGLKTINSKGK